MSLKRRQIVSPDLLKGVFGDSLKGLWSPRYRKSGNWLNLAPGGGANVNAQSISQVDEKKPLASRLIDGRAYFNGSSDWANCNDSLNFVQQTGVFTLGATLMRNEFGADGNNYGGGIICTAAQGSYVGFMFRTRDNDGSLQLVICTGSGRQFLGGGSIDRHKPTSVLATGDGTDVRFYIDGELKSTRAWPGNVSSSASWNTGIMCNRGNSPFEYTEGWLGMCFAADASISDADAKMLTGLGGTKNPPAYNIPNYVSAYPTDTTRELKPEFYISSAGEPDPPAVNNGDASPTNLGEMFYPGGTGYVLERGTASEQPIWLGPYEGWEGGGDDYWAEYANMDMGAVTFFAVAYEATDGDYIDARAANASGLVILRNENGTGASFIARDSDGTDLVDAAIALDTTKPHAIVGTLDEDTAKIWGTVDGKNVVHAQDAASSSFTGHFVMNKVGFMANAVGSYWLQGKMQEAGAALRTLSDADAESLVKELAAKWGIT